MADTPHHPAKGGQHLTPFLLLCLIGFAAGLVCLAGALAALGQTVQLPQLLLCAVVMGVGMALTFTSIGALIAELVPALTRGLAMGMYNSCIYLGMMTGSTVLGLALKRVGYPLGFALAGSTALAALLLFLLMMNNNSALQDS